jgi:hypothetical protein
MGAALLALTLAAARILVPPWPISPDGESVAVTGSDVLDADGADVAPLAPGLWRVVPSPGFRRVTLRAGAERAVLDVERGPGEIAISAFPAAPVKGEDAEVSLDLVVRGPDGEVDGAAERPVLAASCGTVRDVVANGPGRFRAVYEPGPSPAPEVAVLVALSPRCPLCPTPRAVGAASLPIAGAIELPGRTDPRASVTVMVRRKPFGPVRADAKGRFSVPIVVPPGARWVKATSVDRAGTATTRAVDLRIPDTERLACAAFPPALPADGVSTAGIWCAGADPRGRLASPPVFVATPRAGAAGPSEPLGALAHALYRAPKGGAGAESLVARAAGFGAARVPLALAAGAPDSIAVWLAKDPVPPGATIVARLAVLDARGDVLGKPSGPSDAREGFVAPDRFVAPESSRGGTLRAPLSFALPPGTEAATVSLRRAGRDWIAAARTVDARPAVGVLLRFGSGPEVRTDAAGDARVPARGRSETVIGPGGVRAAGWEGFEPPAAPIEIARKIDVKLRPPAQASAR